MHLVIAYAHGDPAVCRPVLPDLRLPHLSRLLRALMPLDADAASPQSLSPPHERALALALGWPLLDGQLPWAAWEWARQGGAVGNVAWARLHPCHWQVSMDGVSLDDPAALQLQPEESAALLHAMRPYFEEDGIALHADAQGQWYARGALFDGLACASLDRVVGRFIQPWMPSSAQAAPLRRLQNEMQMLLYQHPVNDARERRGLPTVNAFWVSGCGRLPSVPAPDNAPELITALRTPALRQDGAAWASAWAALDAQVLAPLVARLESGTALTLTLCGERGAQTFARAHTGWLRRLQRAWRPPTPAKVLEPL